MPDVIPPDPVMQFAAVIAIALAVMLIAQRVHVPMPHRLPDYTQGGEGPHRPSKRNTELVLNDHPRVNWVNRFRGA